MKNRVYYFLIMIVIFTLGYFAFRGITKTEYIAQGYEMENLADEWKSTISYSVNNSDFTLYIDGIEVNAKKQGIYMDTSMILMIPYKQYRDLFNCAVNLYDGSRLTIEKATVEMELNVGSSEMTVNNTKYVLETALVFKDDTLYVPIDAAVKGLGYTCNWDINTNVATIINNNPESSILPYRYSYVDKQKNTVVRKQGNLGTCWATAALTALETSLMPEENYYFSADHMSLNNSFNLEQYEGGSSTMSTAYLLAWQGPVLEADDPYGDGETNPDLQAVKHVQEIQMLESKDLQKIKEMVYKYGGVQTSLYTIMQNTFDYSKYYNEKTNSYCYVGTEKPNHDVIIIRKKISAQILKVMEHLSARTVGEQNLAIMEFSMYPIMILISVCIILCIQEWIIPITMPRYISLIYADGWENLAMKKKMPGFPMYTPLSRQNF